MASLADLRAACHGQRLLWSIRRGSSFFGVHDLFRESVILCIDDSPEFDGLAGARFFTREALRSLRDDYDTDIGSMLNQVWAAAEPALPGRGWRALVSMLGPSIERWAERTGSTVHGREPDLVRRLNDKRTLFEILEHLDLPRVPGEWTTIDARPFSHWARLYGTPVVVQAPTGEGGSGTVFVGDETAWRRAGERFAGHPAYIAPDLGPLSFNINALALPDLSVAGYPSVQLTGFEFLNHPPGAYCGNDFSAVAEQPRALLDDVRLQTERIGDHLAAMGYRGLFGVDFLIGRDDGIARAIDLNPRWQGSTPLFAQAERLAGRVPLAAVAMLYEADLIDAAEAAGAAAGAFMTVNGAQVRMRAGKSGVHRLADPPRPGVHSAAGAYLGPGRLLEDLREGQMLVTGGPPRPGLLVTSGAQLFRVESLTSVLRPGSLEPAGWLRPLTDALMRR